MNTNPGAQILQFPQPKRISYNALDDLLERGLITREQHWCGIHILWLHKLAIGEAPKAEDAQWRAARKFDYDVAVAALKEGRAAGAISNLCFYNEWSPSGLDVIRSGLNILQGLWRKTA